MHDCAGDQDLPEVSLCQLFQQVSFGVIQLAVGLDRFGQSFRIGLGEDARISAPQFPESVEGVSFNRQLGHPGRPAPVG